MTRQTRKTTLLVLAATAIACAQAPVKTVATAESPLESAPTKALEGGVDAWVKAILASDADAARQALSPSAVARIDGRLKERTFADFVKAERAKLVATLGTDAPSGGFTVTRAAALDAGAWSVEGTLGGKAISKALKVESVNGAYLFAGPGGGYQTLAGTSYRIDNNTSTAHQMACTGYTATTAGANQTTYKTCNNYCGFWEGSQFWDNGTSIGACDYNTYGADVVINGATAQCVGPC